MHKLFSKQKRQGVLLLLGFFLLTISCKKEHNIHDNKDQTTTSPIPLTKLKSDYDDQKISDKIKTEIKNKFVTQWLPEWNKISHKITDSSITYYIPLNPQSEIFGSQRNAKVSYQNIRKYLIAENKNNKLNFSLATYDPIVLEGNVTDATNSTEVNGDHFTGYLELKNFSSNKAKLYSYVDGKVKPKTMFVSNNKGKYKVSAVEQCDWIYRCYWAWSCYDDRMGGIVFYLQATTAIGSCSNPMSSVCPNVYEWPVVIQQDIYPQCYEVTDPNDPKGPKTPPGDGIDPNDPQGNQLVLRRLFKNGRHVFTTSWPEALNLRNQGWTIESSLGWLYRTQVPGTVPLYYHYISGNNQISAYYHTPEYRPDLQEYKGVAGYISPGGGANLHPVYQYYYGGWEHLYTINYSELGSGAAGYRYEGIVFYLYDDSIY